jgi:hypothetical protein
MNISGQIPKINLIAKKKPRQYSGHDRRCYLMMCSTQGHGSAKQVDQYLSR